MNTRYVDHNHRNICREVVEKKNAGGIGWLNWAIIGTCAAIVVVGIKIGLAWVV